MEVDVCPTWWDGSMIGSVEGEFVGVNNSGPWDVSDTNIIW